ncbi:hypothetical protein HYY75_11985, partial [bacterium]|nr:hypothetical protein [bacterium]
LGKLEDERSIVRLWWADDGCENQLKEAMEKASNLPISPMIVKWWDEYEKSKEGKNPND